MCNWRYSVAATHACKVALKTKFTIELGKNLYLNFAKTHVLIVPWDSRYVIKFNFNASGVLHIRLQIGVQHNMRQYTGD